MKKVAVISGSAGYIGQAIASKLEADGFELALLYHHTKPANAGKAYQCDFSSPIEITETIEKIEKEHGRIDVAIHAAEPKISRVRLADMAPEQFESLTRASILGAFTFLKECARVMKEQKSGILIGITSEAIDGDTAIQKMGSYVPGKYALHGILRELRGELKPWNIQVHEVRPGFLPGGLNDDLPQAAFEIAEKKWGPLETPEDIAEKISALAHGI